MAEQSEFERFDATVRKMLSVPRTEMLRREADYMKHVDAKPELHEAPAFL